MKKALAGSMLALALFSAQPAHADSIEGSAVIISVVTLGTIGGLTTTISALVHSLDDRTFESPWVVASLFSAAICGSVTVSLLATGDTGSGFWGVVGTFFYAGLTGVPTYWVLRTALADVDPGERFDADVVPAPESDPEAALERRTVHTASTYSLSWSF